MNAVWWLLSVWVVILGLFLWSCVRSGERIEDEAGEFAEDLADAMIDDIQARRKVKSPDALNDPT